MLVALLVTVRNPSGVLTILATGAGLSIVAVYAPPGLQRVGAGLLAWFLVFGGVRAVADLRRGRRRRSALDSDADQLARLTGMPAGMWVLAFAVVSVATVVGSVVLALPP